MGKLTHDDLNVIAGKRDQLMGFLLKRYGKVQAEIEREVNEFESPSGREVTPLRIANCRLKIAD